MIGERWLNWEKIEQQGDIYTPRTGHAVLSYGGCIYLFGGIDECDRQNDILQYRINENLWTRIKANGDIPSARSGSIALIYQQHIYFFGGYTRKHGEYFNDLYKFSPISGLWTKIVTKNPPMARIDHSFCKSAPFGSPKQQNAICILFGGSNGVKKHNDLFELHLDKLEWKKISFDGPQPSGRFGHTSVVENEFMYLFGGWDGSNTLNDLWIYNIITKKWTQVDAQCNPASRYRHSSIIHNNCMYVFGGVDQSQERFGDLHEFSLPTTIWRRIVLQKEGPSPRSFHKVPQTIILKCAYDQGFMYIVGGYDGQRKNDLYRINLELVQIQSDEENLKRAQLQNEKKADVFLLSLTNPEQSIKEYQTLMKFLSTPQKKTSKGLVAAYQQFPTMRWFYIEQDPNVYSPRTGHAAVVAGDSVYVFGGIDMDGSRNNDLYMLDINEQQWKKVPAEGAIPAQRSGARAVYIGPSSQEGSPPKQQGVGDIVIFGGYIAKDISHCNDLVSFNLSSGVWTLLQCQGSAEDVPAKRTDHSMVRYGKFLYVFGGRGENKQIFKDLKRFNVQKEIWKDIKGEGAQIVPRFGHVAVTYDHSMYVFGGWDGMNCLDDLFQYSYVTNIWYEIRRCFGEKPSPRYRHDALMFEDNMYVFGGVDQNQTRFNDLYQFNFSKREWTKVLTSGCMPSPRTFHKIVNKDSLIFLLGGFDGERRNDLHMIKLDPQISFNGQSKDLSLSLVCEDQSPMVSDLDYAIKVLNEQVKELSKKIQREEDKNLCKICFSREIDTVLMECCHFILCFACTTNLKNVRVFDDYEKCPICRSLITKVIQTHLY